MRKRLAALALVYLAAHILLLPPSLEDLDSINFAFGVRHFDVAAHQPHPPGYPVFIALAKASTAALRALGVPAADVRGLALWSAIAGSLLVFLLFSLFRSLDGSARRAVWATLVVVAAPLFWFTALRPLSDMTGLALVVAAQALMMSVLFARAEIEADRPGAPLASPATRLAGGAALAGLALGVRAQSFVLTLPLLALAILIPAYPLSWRQRLIAPIAFAGGVLAWGIPLIVAAGGLGNYLAALGAQGGEDLAGVPILWTMRTKQVAKAALLTTYVWPWDSIVVAAIVLIVALVGLARIGWTRPRALIVLAVAFAPYAAFHPLFHDVANGRNAVPLLLPVAYLFVAGVDWAGRSALPIAAGALVAASLAFAIPASAKYAREGSPTFHALKDVAARASEPNVLGLHATYRRAVDWNPPLAESRMLKARHGTEWLRLVEHWRSHPDVPAWFVADPKRSDLALIDTQSRRVADAYRWPFPEAPYVGGARPGNADLIEMSPPGWMLDRGWSITAEAAGNATRDNLGPHVAPVVAWIRSRDSDATLIVGGRHLESGAPNVRLSITLDGAPIESWTVAPGYFVRRIELPAASLHRPAAYVPLAVKADAADGSGRLVRVALEQFDLQSAGVPMFAFDEGWYEPEYELLSGRAWRWMSERALLWVRPLGRDVTLRLAGESPLRYYDAAPTLRVMIGDRELAHFTPSSDFTHEVTLPDAALAAAAGRIIVTSDEHFVPAERGGPADRRHLAIRMYTVEVR